MHKTKSKAYGEVDMRCNTLKTSQEASGSISQYTHESTLGTQLVALSHTKVAPSLLLKLSDGSTPISHTQYYLTLSFSMDAFLSLYKLLALLVLQSLSLLNIKKAIGVMELPTRMGRIWWWHNISK